MSRTQHGADDDCLAVAAASSDSCLLCSGAGFAQVDGDIRGVGYNETKVDLVTVPCPGADPVETWSRDPLPEDYFGPAAPPQQHKHCTNSCLDESAVKELAATAILSPAITRHLPRAAHVWVRQGVRSAISTARVMMYTHRRLEHDTHLDALADDLLHHLAQARQRQHSLIIPASSPFDPGQHHSRPLFFVCHSIGGLVVKLALVKASRDERYRTIFYNCHGVTFFGTPHRGSSYLSMPHLSTSIQQLLRLERPLPSPLSDNLRLNHRSLVSLNDDFVALASELHVWTFYETVDSQLSGPEAEYGMGMRNEVRFGAPLVSIKSSLLGLAHEHVYSLESEHADCASFGPANTETMHTYLEQLAEAAAKAQQLSDAYTHAPLKLTEHVKIELIGFYEDQSDTDTDSDIRLYFTRYHLADFLEKGPERCLEERLTRTIAAPPPGLWHVAPARSMEKREERDGPGILSTVRDIGQFFRRTTTPPGAPGLPADAGGREREAKEERGPDEHRPANAHLDTAAPLSPSRPSSTVHSSSMPVHVGRKRQSLTVPALSTPVFGRSSSRGSRGTAGTMSDVVTDISPNNGHHPLLHQPASHHPDEEAPGGDDEGLRRASVLPEWYAGFARPDPSRRKFMWVHLPFNNPPWVREVFSKLGETHPRILSTLFNNENWASKHIRGHHSRSQPSFVKPSCGFIPAGSMPSPRPSSTATAETALAANPAYLYLYLPYLHFDRYINTLKRRNIIQRRTRHGRARPVPSEIADQESLETRVIWQYLGDDPPVNYRRTLDQFGYPSLQDTYARDDDQMLYKLTKDEAPPAGGQSGPKPVGKPGWYDSMGAFSGEMAGDTAVELEDNVRDGNMLMVDQLWLWAIDTGTLVTFFPKRESHPTEGQLFHQADLRNSVYNELNGDLTGRCDNSLDLAAFITLHAVTVLLDRSSHPDLEVFRLFEEAIGILTERLTSSLKRYRMQSFTGSLDGDGKDGDMDDNRTESIKRRHRRELEQAERENREKTSALLELRDLEDELTTLTRLFETQEMTVRSMSAIYAGDELKDSTVYGQRYLEEALSRIEDYKQQTGDMLKRVDTTRNDYEKLLEMVQRQAQVDEVRWSRLQTELASSQNLSVMIFTTFTVIFLPLSFFTSLFGMNTAEWDGPDSPFPTLGLIGAIALPVSAFLIAGSLVAAFSSRVQGVFRLGFRAARSTFDHGKKWLGKLQPSDSKEASRRRREWQEQRDNKDRRRKEQSYDFWATVRRQRNSEYRIPELNRKTTPGRRSDGPKSWRPEGEYGMNQVTHGVILPESRGREPPLKWRS